MALPAFILRHFGEGAYAKRIAKGLDGAWSRAATREIDIDDVRIVVFSDHHRGKGDGADDFARCEQAYCSALGWYLEQGYELWLLGDVEELWENRPRHVIDYYDECLDLERKFGARLHRFFGNHDMAWRREKTVRNFLAPHLPNQADREVARAPVIEAMRLRVSRSGRKLGTVFFVHGHQGTLDSGNLLIVPFSRFIVRVFWGALQRSRRFASTSPATDTDLRSKHDRAMAAWADPHPDELVLVAGHTHHPVFPRTRPPDLTAEVGEAESHYRELAQDGDDAAFARAAWELVAAKLRRSEKYEPPELKRSSYFNTGCCSFGDGDVTGLDFSDGKVHLVRWLDNSGDPRPEVLKERDLEPVLLGGE